MRILQLILLIVIISISNLSAVTYITKATGNFTAAGTWSPISAEANAELDSEASSTSSTTSLVYSSTFTPLAANIDGVAVKLAARIASPTGTFTITLANNTSPGVREGSLSINASDVDTSGLGWYFFKFGSVVSPNGTDVYKIGLVTSINATVTLYRDGTAGNWSRMLRLTSAASAPAASDKLMLMGEWTAAATLASFTVTMNNTSTTSFGPTVSGGPPQGMTVNKGATFNWGVVVSTNYYLKWKGVLGVYGGATVNVGTSGTPIPATSSAVLEMDSVANVDTGIRVESGAIFNSYGATKTVVWTYLNTDEAVASTVIGVVSTAGWLVSDELAFASTSRTYTESEKKIILTVDSGVQVTLTAGLTNAHSGTSPTRAEVGNLTRNVIFRGISTSLQGFIWVGSTPVVILRYAEFSQLGANVSNKHGIDVAITTGSFDMQFCSFHDFIVDQSIGIYHTSLTSGVVTISNNVGYNIAGGHYVSPSAFTGASYTLDSNLFIRTTSAGGAWRCFDLQDVGGTFTNNTAVSAAGSGFFLNEVGSPTSFTGNTSHSHGGYGIDVFQVAALYGTMTLSNTIIWRSTDYGLLIRPNLGSQGGSIIIDNLIVFGQGLYNVYYIGAATLTRDNKPGLWLKNLTVSGDTTFSSPTGMFLNGGDCTGMRLDNSTFGVVSGIKTAHTTQDIALSANVSYSIDGGNVTLASSTPVTSNQSLVGSYLSINKFGQVVGTHKTFLVAGSSLVATLGTDTSIFRTASPSVRLTPVSAAFKLSMLPKTGPQVAITSGIASTPLVYVRLSVVGDGAAYNGAAPRLFVRANPAVGINTDTLLATHSGATGVWELLSAATIAPTDDGILEFYVDCDGTAGWINIDDFTVSPNNIFQGGMKYWISGLPGTSIGNGTGSIGSGYNAAFTQ